MARCYHRLCGREFGGQSAFDRHMKLLKQAPWLECLDPADISMVLGPYGWGMPSSFASLAPAGKS